jgi:hypothetical protein
LRVAVRVTVISLILLREDVEREVSRLPSGADGEL